jgi:hypothetical protein
LDRAISPGLVEAIDEHVVERVTQAVIPVHRRDIELDGG